MDFNKAAPWRKRRINPAIADVRKTASWVQFRPLRGKLYSFAAAGMNEIEVAASIGRIICANENKRASGECITRLDF